MTIILIILVILMPMWLISEYKGGKVARTTLRTVTISVVLLAIYLGKIDAKYENLLLRSSLLEISELIKNREFDKVTNALSRYQNNEDDDSYLALLKLWEQLSDKNEDSEELNPSLRN